MTITPNVMPRKANPVHQKVLGALIETVPVSWSHKTIDPKTDEVVKTKVSHRALRFPLAQNVSEENVDRMAKRWIR